jgi:epsilon-lactone hydrolase
MASAELAQVRTMWEELVASLAPKEDGSGPTIQDFRDGYEGLCARFTVPEDATFSDVDADGVPCIEARAAGAGDERTIIYFHGGGYVIGSAGGYKSIGAALSAAADGPVLLVDYRLAPEHPYPAAVEDALTVYRWVLAHGREPGQVVLAGDSAGGGLTAAALVAIKDAGLPAPAGGVPISPWCDLACTGGTMDSKAEVDPIVSRDMVTMLAGLYLGEQSAEQPHVSAIHADLQGLPPMYVLVGTAETLLDDARTLAERARAAGVELKYEEADDMYHVWPVFCSVLPEGQEAVERIGQFARERTAAGAAQVS